jgi:hypothetical protein
MATQVQFRRGSSTENNAFTGALGEVTVDTTNDTIRVHDGSTAGGFSSAKLTGTQNITLNAQAELRLGDSDSSNYVGFKSPATVSSNLIFTLPSADGTSGQALVTDASGNLSFAAAGATISGDTSTNTDFLLYFASSTSGALTAVKQDSGLTYNPSSGSLTSATFIGALTGNASGSAATLATARAIALSGDVVGTANFDGSAGISISTTIQANSVALGTDTTGNYVGAGATSGSGISGSVSSEGGTFTVTSNATSSNTANTIVFRDGSGNFTAGVVTATATAARYADLAERYTSDSDYAPGTVVVFGGDEEVTQSTQRLDRRVAGIVSTDPAYLMNSELENSVAVGLQGRVPCKVVGEIRKGDMMVTSSTPGHAEAWHEEGDPPMGTVIGKALENKIDSVEGVIEVVVGRM